MPMSDSVGVLLCVSYQTLDLILSVLSLPKIDKGIYSGSESVTESETTSICGMIFAL